MGTLLLISFLIFLLPLLTYVIIKGVPSSISATFYGVPRKIGILFTLYCWGYSITLMIPVLTWFGTPWVFFTASAICFVGAAAAYKDGGLTEKVHMRGAFIGVLFSQISLILDFNLWFISVIALAISGLLFLIKPKNYVTFAEITIILSVYIASLIHYINE